MSLKFGQRKDEVTSYYANLKKILIEQEQLTMDELRREEKKACEALDDRIEMLQIILGDSDFESLKEAVLGSDNILRILEMNEDLLDRKSEYEKTGSLTLKATLPAVTADGWIRRFQDEIKKEIQIEQVKRTPRLASCSEGREPVLKSAIQLMEFPT